MHEELTHGALRAGLAAKRIGLWRDGIYYERLRLGFFMPDPLVCCALC